MARSDTRDWAKARRERTRHLIELGGLVQKAGLVELVDDDRLQEDKHQGGRQADQLARWRRRGLRVFDADRDAAAATTAPHSPDQAAV
jgi:hypothetical protein